MAQRWQVAIGMTVLIAAVLVGIDRVQAITDRQEQAQARVVQTEAAATNTSARQRAARETAQVDRAATFAAIQATATALTSEIALDNARYRQQVATLDARDAATAIATAATARP